MKRGHHYQTTKTINFDKRIVGVVIIHDNYV